MHLTQYLDFAHMLADAADGVARQYFRSPHIHTTLKADDSPVTQADVAIEQALRDMIQHDYPDHGIVGEEQSAYQPDAPWQWVLDPIDGTRAFTCGTPSFTTLIGLMHHQTPALGIISQPITRERWYGATDSHATLNGQPISSSTCSNISHARFATTSPDLFTLEQLRCVKAVQQKAAIQHYGGDAYNYGLLAAGHIDIIMEAGLKPHDIFPLLPVLTGAGATVSDWEGHKLDTSNTHINVIVTANTTLHKQVLDFIHT